MKTKSAAFLMVLLVLTACSGWRPHGETAAPEPAPAPSAASAQPRTGPVESVPKPTPPSPPAAATAESQVANNAPAAPKTASALPGGAPPHESPVKSQQPPSRTAPRPAPAVPGSPVASKQPAANPPAEQPPTAPTLDIPALEQRLKETHAIGIFTKLSLKNQVDDLLAQFRAHHRGNGSPPLSELRQRYDLLMIKVLSLLQDGDPPLAKTIGSSREAIWSILSDPNKLAAISS